MRNLIAALRHPHDYRWWALRPWRRHSLVLLVAGIVHIVFGLAYALLPGTAARESALRVPLALFGMNVWGAVFVAVGMLAVLSARWPPASETWGYTALSALAALWASFYAWGIVLGASPANATGAGIWGLVGFLWWAIAGLVNPHDLPANDDREG